MFGQSLLSAFDSAVACTTDTNQLFGTDVQNTSLATYQLNNATTSIPSNTYPGTASNVTYAAGKFGNAAVFTNSSSVIVLPNSSFEIDVFSLSAWVNPATITSGGSNRQVVFSTFQATSGATGYIFNLVDGQLSLYIYGNSVVQTLVDAADAITAGSWFHVAATYDSTGNVTKLYINGVEKKTGTAPTISFPAAGLTQPSIGAYWYSNSHQGGYFNGSIDQVRVFNTVLPQAAITALYNETTTTATYPYVDYVNANPNSVAYYKMSDATDQFGNYNGTATNVNFNTVGKFGFAGAFNGSSSKIVLGTNTFNSLTNFSFSCWVNLNNAPATYEYLFDGWDYQSASSRGLAVRINSSGNIQANTGFSNSVTVVTSSGTITNGVWTHIAVSITQSSTTISINGNTESPQSNGGFDFHTGTTYNLGAFIYTTSFYEYFLDGKLDQIRIYDAALSAANVTTLYNEIECPVVEFAVDYLVVAGGGAGAAYGGGGGGAGGLRTSYGTASGGGNSNESSLALVAGVQYTITIGAGGVGGAQRAQAPNGGLSSITGNGITSITSEGGGGSGIGGGDAGSIAQIGGSGGGGGSSSSVGAGSGNGAAGTTEQGFAGGDSGFTSPNYPSAGGGGAANVGVTPANSSALGGNGGPALEVNIIGGSNNYYAGGGGGTGTAGGGTGGTGGGNGATFTSLGGTSAVGTPGSPNTGGGAGGGSGIIRSSPTGSTGVSGGSGIVILRYPSGNSINVGSGLSTGVLNGTVSGGTDKYTTFTLGSGDITFS